MVDSYFATSGQQHHLWSADTLTQKKKLQYVPKLKNKSYNYIFLICYFSWHYKQSFAL